MRVEKHDINAAKKAVKDEEKNLGRTRKDLKKLSKIFPKGHQLLRALEGDVKEDEAELAACKKYLADLERRYAQERRHKK